MIALPTDFDPTAENILLDYKVVPLEQIHPNPWNPNQMTDAEENALAESMEKYGDFDPILVRPHPDLEGAFQIIDGEHRWKTRVADGKKFALVNIRHSNDQEAQHLTGITILDRGTPDKLKLAQLLAEVEAMSSIEETLDGLPMAKNELEELLALAKHDWRSDLETPPAADKTSPETTPPSDWETFTVTMTKEAHRAYLDAFEVIKQQTELDPKPNIAHGQVLEALSADFLVTNSGGEGKKWTH